MENLERTFGYDPEAWTINNATITARYKGRDPETFMCAWNLRYRLSEILRKRNYTIYDIK